MLADIQRRPWKVGGHGRLLGELHCRLGAIPAPEGAASALGRGDRLVHGDFHPENVLLSPRGAMVIDWSNGGCGEHADDVASTWAIIATSAITGPLPFQMMGRAGRSLLVNAYRSRVDEAAARTRPEMAAYRLANDPHLLDPERRALARLAAG